MKKSIAMAGSILFLVFFATGCGSKSTQETPTATTTAEMTTAAVKETTGTRTNETGAEEYGSLEGDAFVSVEELNKKIGFDVLVLPEHYGLKPNTIQCIPLESDSGYIGYVLAEGETSVYIDLYTVGGNGTKSVLQNEITMAEREVNGIKVLAGEGVEMFEGIRSARWKGSSQNYEVITLGQNEEAFDELLKELLKITVTQ